MFFFPFSPLQFIKLLLVSIRPSKNLTKIRPQLLSYPAHKQTNKAENITSLGEGNTEHTE